MRAEYLEARLRYIDEMDAAGSTVDEILDVLSVDRGQILLLVITARQKAGRPIEVVASRGPHPWD